MPYLYDNPRQNFPWKHVQAALCLITASIIYCPSNAQATKAPDQFELSPEQLFGATVMSVSKKEEKLLDAPAAIYVLTNEDITRSGATSIPEVLRLVPGVNVARINTGGWALSVRGFNGGLANKLLVLIDGREVYDALFSGVYWDVQDTVLEDIERIEIIRGPGATLWGSNAVNGVINIITKNAKDSQGGLLTATAGNQERALGAVRYGGKMGENAYYRVYGKYLNRDDQTTLSGDNAHDDWQASRSGFRTDWENDTQKDSYTLQGDMYDSSNGQFRSTPSLTAPYATLQQESIQARGANILGRWNRELAKDIRFTVQSYLDYNSRDQLLVEDQRASFDLDAHVEFPLSERQEMTVGGKYRFSSDEITPSRYVTLQSSHRNDQTFSGFVQDKITLMPETWFLTLGSKFEHNDYSGVEVQPSARLQWHPSKQQMLWTSISRAVRTPSRLEHDLNIDMATFSPSAAIPLPISLELLANPQFDSEKLIAYELGYRHQWTPSLLFDVAVFYNDYSKLSTVSVLTPSVVQNGVDPVHVLFPITETNNTSGRTYGVETVVNWRALDTLNFSAAHSFLDIQLDGPPSNVAINSEAAQHQSPQHQFNIRSLWNITTNLSLDTTLFYVSALKDYDIDGYVGLDMRLGVRITDQLQFNLVAQNMLDARHQEFTAPTDVNATKINRSLYGKITWHF